MPLAAAPYLAVAKRSGNAFSDLASPFSADPALTGAPNCVAFSPDGTYLALGGGFDNLVIFKRAGDVFTRLSSPDGPDIQPGTVDRLFWSPDGAILIAQNGGSNTFSVYHRSGDAFTKVGQFNANAVYGWSPNGSYFAAMNAGNYYQIKIYKWDGSTFSALTTLSHPSLDSAVTIYDCKWSTDSTYLAASYYVPAYDGTGQYLLIWKRAADTFTQLDNQPAPADQPSSPTDIVSKLAWTPDGQYLLALAGYNTPYSLRVYERSGDIFALTQTLSITGSRTNDASLFEFSSSLYFLLLGLNSSDPSLWMFDRSSGAWAYTAGEPASYPEPGTAKSTKLVVIGESFVATQYSSSNPFYNGVYLYQPYQQTIIALADDAPRFNPLSALGANLGDAAASISEFGRMRATLAGSTPKFLDGGHLQTALSDAAASFSDPARHHPGYSFSHLSDFSIEYTEALSFTDDDTYLAVTCYNAPYVRIFKRNGDTFSELASPLSPAPSASANFSALSSDGTYLAVSDSTPMIAIYKRSGDVFNRIADPDVLPDDAWELAWSPDGTYLAVAAGTSPTLCIYKRTGDSLAKLPDPATMPASYTYTPAWSPDGNYLAFGDDSESPYVFVYKRTGDTFDLLGAPDVALDGTGQGLAWDVGSGYLSVASNGGSVPFQVYKRTGDIFTKLANPAFPATATSGIATSYSPQYPLLALATTASNLQDTLAIYSQYGDTLTRLSGEPGYYPSISPATPTSIAKFGANYLAAVFQDGASPGAGGTLSIFKIDYTSGNYWPASLLDGARARFNPLSAMGVELGSDISGFSTPSRLMSMLTAAGFGATGDAFDGLFSSLAAADALSVKQAWGFVERMASVDQLSATGMFASSVSDALLATDRLLLVRQFLLNEGLTLSDLLDGTRVPLLTLVDAMVAADAAASVQQAVLLLAAALAIRDSAVPMLSVTAADTLAAVDALSSAVAANVTLLSAAVMDAVLALQVSGTAVLIERPAAGDDSTSNVSMTDLLGDAADSEAVLILDGIPYAAWVVNRETGAASEYRNWNFESMCRLGNRYYGASEQGLFLLDGSDDAGDPIEASFKTGDLDFGSPQIKRPVVAHVGYTATGAMLLKVTVVHQGKRTEYWYRCKQPVPGEASEARIPLGKGLASRHWQFEIVNVDGADFEFELLLPQMLELSRRI